MARASIAGVTRETTRIEIGNIEKVTSDMLRVFTADTALEVLKNTQAKGQFPKQLSTPGSNKPGYIKIVDRRHGADEYTVRPGGRIMYQANVSTMAEVIEWIGRELVLASVPLYRDKRLQDTGWRAQHYEDQHLFMIDGKSVTTIDGIDQIVSFVRNFQFQKHVTSKNSKYQFVNIAVYARRIEFGATTSKNRYVKPWSSKAPSGVYRAVARAAKLRFGQTVRIDYKSMQLNLGVKIYKKTKHEVGQFYPTIIVRARDTTLGVS